MHLRNVFWVAVTVPVLLAGDMPYVGTWKMNLSKSEMTGTTITYAKLPSGEWQATTDGVSYKFKMDGKEYPDNLGDTVVWKSVDANTFEAAWKTNGKALSTDTVKVANDVLTVNTKGTKPNGEPIDDKASFARVSGGPGLAGKWKSTSIQSGWPEVIVLASTGGGGLSYRVPAYNLTCDGKLDGKDYPCTGTATAPGWGVAMSKEGTNSFSATVKKDGKTLYKFVYTPSADAKVLTVAGGATATNEKIKMVYDRQ